MAAGKLPEKLWGGCKDSQVSLEQTIRLFFVMEGCMSQSEHRLLLI